MKNSYFIKRKRRSNKDVKPHQHRKKLKNTGRTKPNKKKENKLARHKLALKTRRFQLQELSNNKAAKCQQKPAQPRAAEFHNLHRFKINDNSSQVSNFHFQISTLMSKDHASEQKPLVLFRAPSPQRPPVTNYQRSTTCI